MSKEIAAYQGLADRVEQIAAAAAIPSYKSWRKRVLKQNPPPALPLVDADMLADPVLLFHHLTRWTVPHGFEDHYYEPMLTALGFAKDPHGNYFREIALENGEKPTSCFMAHLDTSSDEVTAIVRYYEEGMVYTDQNSILGADDRAGVTIILYMIGQGIPGLYYLFIGEEESCAGSGALANSETEALDHILRMISFDRKGDNSVITHQMGDRCCSDAFAYAVCRAFNEHGFHFAPDDGGSYTDSREFMWMVSECTNLSVGYDYQHSHRECQDIDFLKDLCVACTFVDWESLPAERDQLQAYMEEQRTWGSGGFRESASYDSYTYDYIDVPSVEAEDIMAYQDACSTIEKIVHDFQNGYPVLPTELDALVTNSRELNLTILERLIDRLQESCY